MYKNPEASSEASLGVVGEHSKKGEEQIRPYYILFPYLGIINGLTHHEKYIANFSG